MIESIAAYCDDVQTITVDVSRNFYQGDAGKFYLQHENGKIEDCRIRQIETKQNLIRYTVETFENIEIGKDLKVVSEKGYQAPLQYRLITQKSAFDELFSYDGDDLGAHIHEGKTTFKVWAPTASRVFLDYEFEGMQRCEIMRREDRGVFSCVINQNLDGAVYQYLVHVNGQVHAAIDPYGKSSTANGKRSAVIDIEALKTRRTSLSSVIKNYTDAIIYEASVRDMTIAASAGTKKHGTFMAMVEEGTRCDGEKTGFDYLCDLGITHLQLLPVMDFMTVDELHRERHYNWGYDPAQFMTLEGSYSSNANDPAARVHEFMTLVNKFHSRNIAVNLDVVFNHHYDVGLSCFDRIVPYYYFRVNENGTKSNGSFCGNDFESRRAMFRKYILDTCSYYVDVFGIDGFRFDLMGIIDVQTMNLLDKKLRKDRPEIMLYGEGWNMPTALTHDEKAMIENQSMMPNIGFFNDYFRDHLKGSTSEYEVAQKGFVTGDGMMIEAAKFSLAATAHPDLFHKFDSPCQSINYVECHDNATLWDKMKICCANEVREIRVKRQKMMNAVVLLAQGVPFLHAGQEFCRTKNGYHNTYNMPDRINCIDWLRKNRHLDLVNHLKDVIELRKKTKGLRYATAKEIQDHVSFEKLGNEVLLYTIKNTEVDGIVSTLKIIINASRNDVKLKAASRCRCLLNEQGACDKTTDVLEAPELSVTVYQCY
ncbi:MAG: type I pullulanase [Erysipelotrichaceae bacterium]|nr:type I pullulanase [Erysipelotrichaceae bacterium]